MMVYADTGLECSGVEAMRRGGVLWMSDVEDRGLSCGSGLCGCQWDTVTVQTGK